MFLTLIIVGIKDKNIVLLDSSKGTVASQIEERDDYYRIYSYDYFDLGKKYLVILKKAVKYRLPVYKGTQREKLQKIINYLSKYEIDENQSNPNLIIKYGGNCQAYALLLDKMCQKNGIESELKGTKDHVYVIAHADGKTYKVDIINKSVEEVV